MITSTEVDFLEKLDVWRPKQILKESVYYTISLINKFNWELKKLIKVITVLPETLHQINTKCDILLRWYEEEHKAEIKEINMVCCKEYEQYNDCIHCTKIDGKVYTPFLRPYLPKSENKIK